VSPNRDNHPSVRSAAVSATIEVTGVSKAFGDLQALAPVDLHVGGGEIVTVLGPSGSGKTTLLRIVGGLDEPTSGSVTVDGMSPHSARGAKRIGFVPQSPALLPWRTVAANARLLLDVNRRHRTNGPDATELLAEVGLSAFADAYPHELSGGMQQRVALVRAIALGAPLLLMDEPFAALDEITRADMRHLLARLCDQLATTVLFVTHSIAESVFISDRVVVLSSRPGRIVGDTEIDLPRPRHPELEDDPAFFVIETRLRGLLHEGAGR
jgi:NitT/TauT family transport system ATP-binding protein